ncbi:MAG TPA: hypothetical protein VGP47_01425 [Parachlamydiaceae bacterium]|nr:hypothetical protein [Parachlamydiaceae bacterium]
MQKPLASYIDHTLLRPDATQENIETLCEEAKRFQFACVCINPCWVGFADRLRGRGAFGVRKASCAFLGGF